MPKPFKLAMVQMLVKGGEKSANIAHAIELIKEASTHGAEVVLLPECLDLGWTHPSALKLAEPIPEGGPCRALSQAAKDNGVYVCAGITEQAGERTYNAAVIIDKEGEVLLKHRKLNELEIGHPYYDQGDRLNVVETEFGTLGLMICADGFANDQVLARSLCYMGADVILSPCAWARPADHDNDVDPYGGVWRASYIPVAKKFSTAIFGASNVGWISDGPWKGRKCVGCSLAIDADGTEILQGPYGPDAECILYIDVNPLPRLARGTDWGK
ncbi:MAG: carbon-nitrogen hydrolase family protein [Verrucomicrobia bacterium]|nr:carbon-nitrogen hydrolase family protein [Verrucomicrobiota bacterium]MDA1066284.1 carbon-nitrogen hydrolase family protein [Verrucomicrobiota bacterium]